MSRPEHATLELAGTTLLVVDDVMYRGHSMPRVVETLALEQPDQIRTAVLVDRIVPPYEEDCRIDLLRPGARSPAQRGEH